MELTTENAIVIILILWVYGVWFFKRDILYNDWAEIRSV